MELLFIIFFIIDIFVDFDGLGDQTKQIKVSKLSSDGGIWKNVI